MALELNDLVKVYDNVLEESLCNELIKLYNNSPDEYERVDLENVMTFTQINLTKKWKDSKAHRSIVSILLKYKKKYYDYVYSECFPQDNSFEQIRIKKYEIGESFNTHVDVSDYSSAQRYLSFLFYLNDVDEGGETIFEGLTISPKKGRLAVFPPLWMYPHKGCPPISGEKYIMSCYLHYK